jgi:hypothetical protein
MPGEFQPTDEQQAARDTFAAGRSFVLQAGAGTGKTATLKLLAESTPDRKGLYVAFNTAVAAEARAKFPSNVTVKTVHALAMHGTGFAFKDRLNKPKVPLYLTAQRLGVFGDFRVGPERALRPTTQASLAMRTVRRFCASADDKIKKRHVPMTPGLNLVQQKVVARHVVPLAKRVWADVSSPISDNFRFEHDHYLKVWALTHPHWQADFVLYDEAQDANPVVSGMVADQLDYGRQLVAVGDSAQGIYGWRGAIDALETFDVDIRLPLTQSFRFGERIAEEANLWLELLGSDMRLSGRTDLDSRVVPKIDHPDAVLCRTNGAAVAELFSALEDDVRVGLVGGGKDLLALARAALDLKAGKTTEHEELALFRSWAEVQDYADSGDDPNLAVLVRVIEEHGPPAIIEAIEAAAHEQHAERTVSTLHKAKGREWDKVRLTSDYSVPRDDGNGVALPSRDELMVSYVAVTRAMSRLSLGNLDWARVWLDKPPVPTPHGTRIAEASGSTGAATRETPKQAHDQAVAVSSGKPWTRKLDDALLSQYRSGTQLAMLAKTFGRPESEILARLSTLRPSSAGTDLFDESGVPRRDDDQDEPSAATTHRPRP